MSFDKDTRNLLAKTVTACRRRLIEDVTDQLRGVFGLHPDGIMLPLDKLTHLSPEQTSAAQRLRDLLDHYTVGAVGKEPERRKAAYERMRLEISFTVLNRLAALRLCEERGLVVECVRKGTASDGFQMFERISGGALGGRYDTYRVFLECLFDELALDLGVLFDRMTPQSAVFPSERCMKDVLVELNKPELTHLWTEDETIGWVYQYFNPPEERKAMRKASQAPRNSRELAVRNQFFTPRYVAEFLTDNTLGRIWYEMRKGGTALKEECRYLVRRPHEVFLAPGEKAPADKENHADLSQEELLRKPVYIKRRPKKDPRDLRVLDPACGSGHFLLYTFDLLERIYEEAWADPESPKSEVTGRTLQEDFEILDDLRRTVPKLIVEQNLHGIDIDPRAVQIAALALWLRAQKTWKNLGIKAAERPRITRSNIVTAEPMPGEEDMRREFTAGIKPRVLGQLVDIVFDKMKLAGEAGSLLKIEEEIKDSVAEAKKQWLEGPKPEQQFLFPGMADPQPKQQELRFDVKGVTDERFWEQAEDHILNSLKDYAEREENGHAIRRRLFAEDAARGFAFIDLCRKRYDVVLMNPPFGETSEATKSMLDARYPAWNKNMLCAFCDLAQSVTNDNGAIGAIIDKTALVKYSYITFRDEILHASSHGQLFVETGWGVLEANVETACLVIHRSALPQHVLIRVTNVPVEVRHEELQSAVSSLSGGSVKYGCYILRPSSLNLIPNRAIPFEIDDWLLPVLSRCESFENVIGRALAGHSLKADINFRLFWELPPGSRIGLGEYWSTLYNGSEYSRYATTIRDVTRYGNRGNAVPPHVSTRWCNLRDQQKPGIAWGKRGDFVDAHIMPTGSVFTVEGQGLPLVDLYSRWLALGLVNSPLFSFLMNLFCGQHKYAGYVNACPVPQISPEEAEHITARAQQAYEFVRETMNHDETAREFQGLLLSDPSSLCLGAQALRSRTEELYDSLVSLDNDIADACLRWYRVPSEGQGVVKSFWEHAPSTRETLWPPQDRSRCEKSYCRRIVLLTVGIVLGRWDVRIALSPSLAPKLPDPFDPLPVCPPGMLVGPEGNPAVSDHIVSEEWLRARTDANTLPLEGSIKNPTVPDDSYPLRISWDGILVDDPGFNGAQPHRDDIVRRVREVFDLLWKDKANEIEQEACEILGVSDLRDYFRRPTGFFQDHLKRYSKSRRKAPIYWPLSTASGSYTIWLYYHRLSDQTLYTAVNKYVEPKIAETESGIARIEDDLKTASGRDVTRLTDRLNEARTFLGELLELREELLRIAALPFKPDLNDGVIINGAPFHNLFRLRPWAKDTEDCWKKLDKGDYDWAHLAYSIWPDRVREVCKTDRSIAITHGLEALCEVVAHGAKNKGGPGRGKKVQRPEPSFGESGQDAD